MRFWGTCESICTTTSGDSADLGTILLAVVALCIMSFISALDVSIIMIALPTITSEIGGKEKYVWIANSFVVASSVPQPLFGQLANVFGRQKPFIVSTMLFALGSGIAGGASNVAMLIAGRTVQGVGAGGICENSAHP